MQATTTTRFEEMDSALGSSRFTANLYWWTETVDALEQQKDLPRGTYSARGLDIRFSTAGMNFNYGAGVFGPVPEVRKLDDIRKSLLDPSCEGPDSVYNIAMDVGRQEHAGLLREKMLLFGIVVYAKGKLGKEPV